MYSLSGALGSGYNRINESVPPYDGYNGFSSPHSGGAQFLLGDGSVRFVSQNIAHVLSSGIETNSPFELLIALRDGQPIGDF
ncbi:H-X9-DG-CTERM domain-containing protein [Planctomicrobium sp. SH661]|uniref:H-X9-DG-CTERM domain-containing protein n=1 Tax=Planctomicrobium sp. SH661 TaxID=3448124 RepID=UPI003F5C8EE2